MAEEILKVAPLAGGSLTYDYQIIHRASATETKVAFANDSRVPYEIAVTTDDTAPVVGDSDFTRKVIWPQQERQFNGLATHVYWGRLHDVDSSNNLSKWIPE